MKHTWATDQDGAIDYAIHGWFDSDGVEHDGPQCVLCGYSYCAWCYQIAPEIACPGSPE